MDDLVQFLHARLDEDGRLAKDAADHAAGVIARKARKTGRFDPPYDGSRWANDYDHVFTIDGREGQPRKVQIADCGGAAYQLTPHIARHDPARVLAEVDAKRLLLADHPIEPETGERTIYRGKEIGGPYWEWGCANCHINRDGLVDGDGYCLTWRALALPYADHPDYREEWRPTDA